MAQDVNRVMAAAAPAVEWRRLSIAICWTLLLSSAITTTWLLVFTSFRSYDDEGYVLMVTKKILDGGRPYEEVYLQYGPFFVAWKGLVHRLLGVPISHDGVRMETTALLAATFGVVAWGVYMLTRCHATAMLAVLVFERHVLVMGMGEPGHPQFVSLLLTVVTVALIAAPPPRWPVSWSIGIGVAIACLALTKVNSGAYVCLALLTWILLPWAGRRLWRLGLLGAAGVVLQAIVMRSATTMWHGGWIGLWYGWIYWLVWALGLVSVILVCVGAEHSHRRVSLVGLVAGGVATAAVIVSWLTSDGVSLSALLDGVLMRPLRSVDRWYVPVAWPPESVCLSVFCAMLVAAYAGQRRCANEEGSRWSLPLALLQCTFGLFVVWTAMRRSSDALFAIGPAGLWLLLVRANGRSNSMWDFDVRCLVAIGTAWQVLYAYPVAGTQMSYVAGLVALCGIVCGSDGIAGVFEWLRPQWPGLPHARETLAALTVAGVLGYAGLDLSHGLADYRTNMPLRLPGAQWVRLEPGPCLQLRAVTSLVQASGCDTLVSFPGMLSFNFWAKKDSPTALNPTAWMLLTPQEQHRLIADVERAGRACVLTNAPLENMWTRVDLSREPLIQWRSRNRTQPVGAIGPYHLGITTATGLEQGSAR